MVSTTILDRVIAAVREEPGDEACVYAAELGIRYRAVAEALRTARSGGVVTSRRSRAPGRGGGAGAPPLAWFPAGVR